MRTPRRPASHAPRQTAFVPAVPAVVNPPDVPSTVDPKQASARDQSTPPPPRLLDALRLRVKDIGFEQRELVVRDGKGGKDRVTVLPENLIAP